MSLGVLFPPLGLSHLKERALRNKEWLESERKGMREVVRRHNETEAVTVRGKTCVCVGMFIEWRSWKVKYHTGVTMETGGDRDSDGPVISWGHPKSTQYISTTVWQTSIITLLYCREVSVYTDLSQSELILSFPVYRHFILNLFRQELWLNNH